MIFRSRHVYISSNLFEDHPASFVSHQRCLLAHTGAGNRHTDNLFSLHTYLKRETQSGVLENRQRIQICGSRDKKSCTTLEKKARHTQRWHH